jgi:hypothetical protein
MVGGTRRCGQYTFTFSACSFRFDGNPFLQQPFLEVPGFGIAYAAKIPDMHQLFHGSIKVKSFQRYYLCRKPG